MKNHSLSFSSSPPPPPPPPRFPRLEHFGAYFVLPRDDDDGGGGRGGGFVAGRPTQKRWRVIGVGRAGVIVGLSLTTKRRL